MSEGGVMLRRSLATVAATPVVATATGLPVVAVNNYPDEPSEVAASVIDSTLLQWGLAQVINRTDLDEWTVVFLDGSGKALCDHVELCPAL